jgi:Subtilase family/FG-GAP-like repeat
LSVRHLRGLTPLLVVVLALAAPAFAAFPGKDPKESPRINTPNDPSFDRCEGDDEDTPDERECTSYFEEQFGYFGFAPDTSDAVYQDQAQLDEQGQQANVAAGNDPFEQISGVRADTAWKYSSGSPDIGIAILDTGIEWQDEELRRKVRLNRRELPMPQGASTYDANGDGAFNVDDYASDPRVKVEAGDEEADKLLDGSDLIATFSDRTDADRNGYVDDIAGWDFFDDDNDPFDASSCCSADGHGSDRAKSAAGDTNNGQRDASMCPRCQIVPMRVWDTFVVDTNLFGLAVVYAADNGINVVEGAVGGLLNSNFARRAFSYAERRNVALMLVSSDINSANHNYPTNYNEAIYVNGDLPDTAPNEGCGFIGEFFITSVDPPGKQECTEFLNAAAQSEGGVQPSAQPPTTSFFRNSNLTQYGGHADINLMGSTGSENTGQAAGAAGLLQSYAYERFAAQSRFPKKLTGNEVRQLLTMSAEDVLPANTGSIGLPDKASKGWDPHFGYGRVNLAKAMAMISAGRIPPEAQITAPDWFTPINVDRVPARGVAVKARIAAPHSASGVGAWRLEYVCGQDGVDADFKPVPGAAGTGKRNGVIGRLSKALLTDLAKNCDGAVHNDAGSPAGTPANAWPEDPYPHVFQIRLVVEEAGDKENVAVSRKALHAYSDTGLLRGWPRPIGSGSKARAYVTGSGGEASARMFDLNRDNKLDILMPTSSGELWALNARGRPLRSWNRGRPVLSKPYSVAARHRRPRRSLKGFPREPFRQPVIGNVAGNRDPEIVVTAGERVYAYTATGRRLRGFPRRARLSLSNPCVKGVRKPCFEKKGRAINKDNHIKRGFSGSPALADLNGDKKLDIVAGSMDQHLYAWTGRGRMVKGFPVRLKSEGAVGAEIITTPAIADLDGDKKPEVIISTNEVLESDPQPPSPNDLISGFASGATGSNVMYAIKADGKPVDGWPVKIGVLAGDLLPMVLPSHDAAVHDVDGDGNDEVTVSAGTGQAKLVDGDGSVIRTYETGGKPGENFDPSMVLNLADYPSIGDLSGSGNPVVIKGGLTLNGVINLLLVNQNLQFNHVVQAWDPDTGQFVPNYPRATDDFQLVTQPAIAKVGGDGKGRQALVGTGLYQLHAYGENGSEPAGWPKFVGGWLFATASVGDVDGNGKLDVTTLTREGWSFLWRTDVPACGGTNAEWWTFHHDEHSTANYGHDGRPPARPGRVRRRVRGGNLVLTFRAPGDDLFCGKVARYEVRAGKRRLRIAKPAIVEPRKRQTLVLRGAAKRRGALTIRALDEANNAGYAARLGKR